MKRIAWFGLAVGLIGFQAQAADKIRFGTNWLAEAEHGGYYQAVSDGVYAKFGLEVEIVQGGPQALNRALLDSGKIDFYMGHNLLEPFAAVDLGVPTVVVGAIFQKEPTALLAHPGAAEKFVDLQKLTLLMSKDGFLSYFQWMKSEFPGFTDEQYQPYTFDPTSFLADRASVQQGYVTAEPFEIERQGGFKPKIFLLADEGFDTYSTLIETRREMVEEKPDLVRRFVEASIIGWYGYLYGDNAKANQLIKQHNPDMTDAQLAFSIAKLKEYGVIDSGEALTKGIGCMTETRVKSFFDKMVKAKVVQETIDYRKGFNFDFVCKGVGLTFGKNVE